MTQSSDLERENRALPAAGSDSVPGHPSNGRLRIAMTRAVSSAAFALLLGCAAILAGCGSSGGSAPSASEPEVMATPVPASASAPVAEVRAEPSPSATAPAITAVTAGPSPPAATPAATPAPTRSVTPPAQPTRSPGPTPEATLAAVKTAAQTTAAQTPEPTEGARGWPADRPPAAKRAGVPGPRCSEDPTATAVAQDAGSGRGSGGPKRHLQSGRRLHVAGRRAHPPGTACTGAHRSGQREHYHIRCGARQRRRAEHRPAAGTTRERCRAGLSRRVRRRADVAAGRRGAGARPGVG